MNRRAGAQGLNAAGIADSEEDEEWWLKGGSLTRTVRADKVWPAY